MKIVRFKDNANTISYGIMKDDFIFPLDELELSKKYTNIIDLINNIEKSDLEILKNPKSNKYYFVKDVRLLSPFETLTHNILCVGLNYYEHIKESESFIENPELLKASTYFSKRAAIISGPGDTIISDSLLDNSLDYENELAIVIGKKGKNIKEREAIDFVFGFTILNDFSSRSLQKIHGQWFKGKSLDGYTSIGPCISYKDNFEYPLALNIKTKINGEIRQNSNTKYMLKDISKLISELSEGMTLFPGDIIATGTPSGVGIGFNPPRFLKDGDVVECEIEKIGILRNIIQSK